MKIQGLNHSEGLFYSAQPNNNEGHKGQHAVSYMLMHSHMLIGSYMLTQMQSVFFVSFAFIVVVFADLLCLSFVAFAV